MSYNIARRISRRRNTKEEPKRPARDSYFVVDTIRPTGGPTSIVSYSIEPGETLVDENAVTTATKLDKAWFESHANRSHRIRHAVNGEMPGMTTEGYVVVRQINPGFRLRQAFTTPVPLPEDEAPEHIAHAFYDLTAKYWGGTVPAHEVVQLIHSYGLGIDIGDPSDGKPPTVH